MSPSKTRAAKRSAAANRSKSRRPTKSAKRWSAAVDTVSTFPPEGTFTKDARSIARIMATKKVSPKGLGSAIRMVQFFINRAGKDLSPARRRELEKAKHLLQEKLRRQREKKRP
jgi:tRNA(adenine34) deaminase